MLTPAMADSLHFRVRSGSYHDSIVLMQLQSRLAELPGIADAGAVMGSEANRELLTDAGLLPPDLGPTAADDLIVVVRTTEEADAGAAEDALGRVEELLARREGGGESSGAGDPLGVAAYRPKSLEAALTRLPEARWVLVSVPGRWATGVARQALEAGRHVFLFSDNVPVDDEVALKRQAAERGLLVLGPDCGTARVAGVGLGFANRSAWGSVGAVAASGTGLQMLAARLDALGSGLSHALGTGGRDLSAAVAGATTRAALELLARDPATRVIVLISKPPAPAVAARVLAALRATGKPAVVCFLGRAAPFHRLGDVVFAPSPALAAEAAVELRRDAAAGAGASPDSHERPATTSEGSTPSPGRLVGLFSGGTLAQEALEGWTLLFGPVTSNLRAPGSLPWDPEDELGRQPGDHLLLDLGEDHFTRGRPHPMLDPTLVAQRLKSVAADGDVAAILLDVVLGDGAHPDPAAVLAPTIEAAREARSGSPLAVVVVLVGSAADPQDRDGQKQRLKAAGAAVVPDVAAAQEHLLSLSPSLAPAPPPAAGEGAVPLDHRALDEPFVAINVGVETFHRSLLDQGLVEGVDLVSVDWRPPAGGDERLGALLERMTKKG